MKKVLLVEDNKLDRRIFLHILQVNFGNSIRTDEVSDGQRALQYLQQQSYDLIITDLVMPHTEGIELIRRINSEYPASRIIAVSGSNPYYLYMAKKLVIDGLFTKPLNTSLFVTKICDLLHLRTGKKISH